jgi:hypothetical protein
MAELNPPATNLSAAAPSKRTRSKKTPSPVWKFEIVDEGSDSGATSWAELGQTLGPIVDAASNALGEIYVLIAKVALEWKEQFDDERAESKARQRIGASKFRG